MSVGGPLDEERRVGRGEVSIKLSDTPWQGMKRTEHFQLLRNVKNHPPDPADMLPKKKFFFLLRATRFYIKSTLIISKHERTEKKHHYEVVSRWNKNPTENLALCAECELNNVELEKFHEQHDVIKSESFSSFLSAMECLISLPAHSSKALRMVFVETRDALEVDV